MIWLTWRQHRAQLAATAGLIAALSALLLAVGRTVHGSFEDSGLRGCLSSGGSCIELVDAFNDRFANLQFLIVLVLVCPLLVGLFWGAPLVARESEQGTHRLVWTQGVSRRRWLLVKLALGATAAAAVAAVYAAVSTWFAHPFNETFGVRLEPGVFDLQGVVPVAYTLFAFALGVAAGAVFRRVVPAMAATLAGYAVVRGLFDMFLRTRLLPTRVVTRPLRVGAGFAGEPATGDLVVRSRILTADGKVFSTDGNLDLTPGSLERWCPDLPAGGDPVFGGGAQRCLQDLGLRQVETVHPAEQYWSFQVIESLLFLGATVAIVVFAVWWVQRKVS